LWSWRIVMGQTVGLVVDVPETRYARSGDVHVAYQVLGAGTMDLVVVPGFTSHLEVIWEHPLMAGFYRRLAAFARVIVFDKRGTGMSDPVSGAPMLEERMDDVRAVMDAAGANRASVFGISEGGALAMLFAASHPERVSALITYASYARLSWDEDYQHGYPRDALDAFSASIDDSWGSGADITITAPSLADDPGYRAWWGRHQRSSASPGMARALVGLVSEIDVRGALPLIQAPTLVLHTTGDRFVPVEHSRYLHRHIDGSRLVEIPGEDHHPTGSSGEQLVEEIVEFLTGSRPEARAERVLATVMFTDIVGSTVRAADLGDRRWRQLLDGYDAVVRAELSRSRGVEIKGTGDGTLATFDGPARAIECACAIGDAVRALGIEVRAGVHTGEVELRGGDIGGIAVHLGARVASLAGPSEVLVSRTVTDLVAGSGIRFEARGRHKLKGMPGTWQLYAVSPRVSRDRLLA
jgi:pimeloyl-ACP methyl ester carboxylesterase/class 3 adenylate cyclase